MGMRRLLLGVTTGAVVFGFAAASAAASPVMPQPFHGPHMFGGPQMFGNRGIALPGFAPATPTSQASLVLQTDPVNFKVRGVTYVMLLTAYKTIGQPAMVDVELSRIGTREAGQDYDYSLKPGGVGFTANLTTLKTAHLASGSGVAPSTLHLTYTGQPGSSFPAECTLRDGEKTRYVPYSSGTISVSAMGLATGTSFFGNMTARPLTGNVFYDPGCRQSGNDGTSYICLGPTVLRTVLPTGDSWNLFGLHGTSKGLEEELNTSTVSSALTVTQDTGAVGRISDMLPRPSFSATGARALFKTTGDPFMRGIAIFTSTGAPAVSKPHTCTDFRTFAERTFVNHVYRGTLTPGKVSPLRAMFDTGAIPLIAQPAQLIRVVYTN